MELIIEPGSYSTRFEDAHNIKLQADALVCVVTFFC